MNEALMRPRLRHVVLSAAGNTANLIIAGTSLMAALVCGAWWLLVLGLVMYLTFIAWRVMSPGAWRQAILAEQHMRRALPDASQFCDATLRVTAVALHAGRQAVEQALGEAPEGVRRSLTLGPALLDQLDDLAWQEMRRADELARYLQRARREAVQAEIDRLSDLLRYTTDEEAQRDYRSAIAVRKQHLRALEDVVRAHQRAQARLVLLVATIEELPARLMRMRVLSAEAREDLSMELNDELRHLGDDLRSTEEVLGVPPEPAAERVSAVGCIAAA